MWYFTTWHILLTGVHLSVLTYALSSKSSIYTCSVVQVSSNCMWLCNVWNSVVQLLQCDAEFLLLDYVYIVAAKFKTLKIFIPLCTYHRLCCSYFTIEFVMLQSITTSQLYNQSYTRIDDLMMMKKKKKLVF